MNPLVSIIIVTNNSEKTLRQAVDGVMTQTYANMELLLCDTGSKDRSYLEPYQTYASTKVLFAGDNVGFCKGNNVGYSALDPASEYVFFLNPDAFLTPYWIEDAVTFMEKNSSYGALTGTTLGYDLQKNAPSGKYDTTGIFQNWYGKWRDRGQGANVDPHSYSKEEEIPAICGAVYFARKRALESCLLRNAEVFDSSFYMYKEDIDLSLRLKTKRWKIGFLPSLTAYHCRGWDPDRKKMPRNFRMLSAKNELTIQWKSKKPLPILYSCLKVLSVKMFDI